MFAELESNEVLKPVEQTSKVEPEMQSRSGSYDTSIIPPSSREQLQQVLTQAFISQPIVGNVTLSQDQREKVSEVAKNALLHALGKTHLKENYGLTDFHCDILVLETVLLLRNWSYGDNENDTGDDNSNFWEYVFNQYALPYDDNNFSNSHEYKIFRHVIERSLSRHRRLFVKVGQRYYTTMLIHALSPKKKFYAMFEQIFAFYAETLDYHYIEADPAFQAFAYAMKNRFESWHSYSEDNVYIKSVQSSSAIKALFLHCPEYMSDFVERMVCNIDTLVAVGNIQETSYLDTLLMGWHAKRSQEERYSAKRERSKASSERVVTDVSDIKPVYRYESGQVSLVIPSIRLGVESDKRPLVTIYRYPGDVNFYSDKLRYYGDYFCITSSKKTVSVDELLSEGAKRIELRVVISNDGKVIYDSDSRLYRDFIVFSDDGSEISKRPDREYVNIFVAGNGDIQGESTSPDCAANPRGEGLLYRVLIDDKTYITVNGANLFPIEECVGELTLNTSIAPVNHCKYLINQQEYTIYTKQPTLTVSSENQALGKRYRLVVDGTLYSLAEYYADSRYSYSVALPDGYGIHELRIIENATQHRIYTLHYMVIEDFSLQFNGFYYFDNFGSNGSVEISDNAGSNRYLYQILPGQESMVVPYRDCDLSLDIPILCCRLDGEVLLEDKERTIWYKNIPMSALLEVNTPRGYSSTVVIGQRTFMSEKVEIGNEINAEHDSDIETVSVIIHKKGEPQLERFEVRLFDIVFKPSFKSTPLTVENKALLWCIEDNFVGDAESEFELRVYYKGYEIGPYKTGCADAWLTYPLVDGVYDYVIFIKPPGLFAQFEELTGKFARGQFIIGNLALFWLGNHKGFLYRAPMDDKTYITVNGPNLSSIEQMVSELTLNTSIAPVNHCKYLINQQEYTIYTKQPTLTVSSKNQAIEKRYRLTVDGTPYPLAEYYADSHHNCSVPLPDGYGVHELRIIDNEAPHQVYILHYYVVIEEFSLHFNGFYYFDNFDGNGTVEVSDYAGGNNYPYEILPGQESMVVPYREGDLSLDIPILRCRLNGEVLLEDKERTIWYKDIPKPALLEVNTPRDYSSTAMIGARSFGLEEYKKVAIDSVVREKHDLGIETVSVIIHKNGEPWLERFEVKLFDIVFKSTPLTVDNKALLKFDNRAIIITEAIIGNERLKLRQASEIITDFRYIGEQQLNGEAQPYPCYEGCLQYKNSGRCLPYATEKYVRYDIEHEQVNPVKLWIIDSQTIVLCSPSGDRLYIDKRRRTFTDNNPNSRGVGKSDCCKPDYYSYKVIAQSEVKNV